MDEMFQRETLGSVVLSMIFCGIPGGKYLVSVVKPLVDLIVNSPPLEVPIVSQYNGESFPMRKR